MSENLIYTPTEQPKEQEESDKNDLDVKVEVDKQSSPEMNDEKTFLKAGEVTPAFAKVRQSRLEFKVHSPSDALMSPCTQMLTSQSRVSKFSHPQNILRNKHHEIFKSTVPEKPVVSDANVIRNKHHEIFGGPTALENQAPSASMPDSSVPVKKEDEMSNE